MKNFLAAAMLLGTTAIPAFAEDMNVGVVLVAFDNQFQSLIKTAIEEAGAGVEGLSLQFEDGMGDVAKQNDQVSNLIASGVDAIIVSPIDAQGTAPMTAAATAAGIPLIFVNNRPVGDLPDGTAFVGSNETEAGTLEMQEVCRLMGGKGDLLIIMGGLEYEQTRLRTGANEAVLATPECSGIKVADKQAGNWSRDSGANLMTNWLSGGIQPRGVHGRGFAVVAQEVRNLAGRSAKAARETSSLIETSSKRVGEGARLADEAQAAFGKIVDEVKKSEDLLSGIAEASREQARGVAQISAAMNEVARAALASSSQADQLAASSTEMRAATSRVKNVLSHFRLARDAERLDGFTSQRNEALMAQIKSLVLSHVQTGRPRAGTPVATSDRDQRGYGRF